MLFVNATAVHYQGMRYLQQNDCLKEQDYCTKDKNCVLCLAGLDLNQKAPTIDNCATLKDYYQRLYAQTNCNPFEGTLGDLSKCVIDTVAQIYGYSGSCFDTTQAPTMVSTASANFVLRLLAPHHAAV